MPTTAVTGAGDAVGTARLWVSKTERTCRRDTAPFLVARVF